MTTLHAETTIDAPRARVWEALADFGGVWRYSPSVRHSRSLTKANSGLGAERHCDLTFSGASVDERIVDWQEGEYYDVAILRGTRMPPVTDMLAHIEVHDHGEGTRVVGTMTYRTTKGVLGAAMDRVMVRRRLGAAWSGIFAGLKHHVETGEPVDADTPLPHETEVAA